MSRPGIDWCTRCGHKKADQGKKRCWCPDCKCGPSLARETFTPTPRR